MFEGMRGCEHQTFVFLKDVKFSTLQQILHFMYRGQVQLDPGQLEDFLSTARALQIEGLNLKKSTKEEPAVSDDKTASQSDVEFSQPAAIAVQLDNQDEAEQLVPPVQRQPNVKCGRGNEVKTQGESKLPSIADFKLDWQSDLSQPNVKCGRGNEVKTQGESKQPSIADFKLDWQSDLSQPNVKCGRGNEVKTQGESKLPSIADFKLDWQSDLSQPNVKCGRGNEVKTQGESKLPSIADFKLDWQSDLSQPNVQCGRGNEVKTQGESKLPSIADFKLDWQSDLEEDELEDNNALMTSQQSDEAHGRSEEGVAVPPGRAVRQAQFLCGQCEAKLTSEEELASLVALRHQDEDCGLTCVLCKTRFKHRMSLQGHWWRFHKQEDPKLKKKCLGSPVKRASLKVRIQSPKKLKLASDKLIYCEICRKYFSSEGNLKTHKKKFHDSNNNKCLLCGKIFLSKPSLLQHVLSQHDVAL